MYEIFLKLCELKGVAPADVSRATGIRQSTLSNWKTRNTALSTKHAKTIADYFGVSLEYLTTGQDAEKSSTEGTSYYFSDETAALAESIYENRELHSLLNAARGLSPEQLKLLASTAEMFKKTNPEG